MHATTSFETFEKALDEVRQMMDKLATETQKPIYDGPVQPEKYFHSPVKILWILKEAYDTAHQGAGGFDYSEYTGQEKVYENFLKDKPYRSTWYPIIFASYGILTNFIEYDHISFIEDDPTVADVLHQIAVININKLAGGTTSRHTEINRIFHQNKDLLLHQVRLLQPDIVIGGGTLGYFHDLLGFKNMHSNKSAGDTPYFYTAKQIFIQAKHPAHITRGKKRFVSEPYVDDIVGIAAKFLAEKSGH